MFYPHVAQEDMNTLESVFGRDALCSTKCNWVNMYKSLTKHFGCEEFQYRVRTVNVDQDSRSFSLNSYKSGVVSVIFTYL